MAINTSNNKVRIISTTVSGLTTNSKFSDIKSPALVVNTSEGGVFYADGSGGTSLKQLAALPSHTHSDYLPKTGGTVTGTLKIESENWGEQLNLNRPNNGDNWGPTIRFYADNSGLGAISMKDDELYVGDVAGNSRTAVSKVGHTHSGYATTTQLADYLPKSGGIMNSTAYIAWNNGAEGNDISDWNTITSNGLRIISSTTTTSNAPTQYSTALHVKGRYGFQIAGDGGESTSFYIRNIDSRSNSWKTIIHSGNIGQQTVASATKLTTGRSIFGNNFNGTTDILGGANATSIANINATASDANNWTGKYSLKLQASNNAMTMLVSSAENDRKGMIQVGHTDSGYANHLGELYLNPLGGKVIIGHADKASVPLVVNGGVAAHSFSGALYGNADTATKSTNSYRLLSNSNSDSISQDNAYDVNPGLHFWKVLADVSNNSNDGFIFQWNWSAGSVGGQLYVDDNPSNTMMIRGRNQNGAYTKWNKFLHSGNYTDYCSSLGHGHSDYLPKTGGTLTSSGVTTLNLVDTARNESGISYAGNGGAMWFAGKGVGLSGGGEHFGFYNGTKGLVANLDINGNLTATKFVGSLQGNADSATVMSSFDTASQSTTLRYVWMSWSDNTGKPAYSDKLTFQTSTNTLFVNDKAVSLSGHTHSYLPLSGGTLTGTGNVLTLTNSQRGDIGLKFDRNGNTAWEIVNTGGNLKFNELVSNTTRFILNEASQATTAAAIFAGNVKASNFITDSDRRLKTNINEISSDKLSNSINLNFVEFDYKNNDNHSAGHIAQEVKEVLPEFVHGNESETEYLSIDYTGLHSIQIKALLDRIIKLEEEIKILKSSK